MNRKHLREFSKFSRLMCLNLVTHIVSDGMNNRVRCRFSVKKLWHELVPFYFGSFDKSKNAI